MTETPKEDVQALESLADPFRLLVDAVVDYAIFMLDPQGRVATWNAGAERINGYTREEILGCHLSVFYPEDARARHWPEQAIAAARDRGRFEDEGPRVRKDGTTFFANVVLTPVYDAEGRLRGYAKVTRDLTDRRRVEALEKAERQTNEFLAMLAHELRNPLAPIRNALHLLTRKPTNDPAELWVREVLERQTVQMTRLVDDLLDISRITRSTVALSRSPLDLRKAIREAADASAQWMQARRHELVLSLPEQALIVDADAVRVSQIVQNLLHNAAKFTPDGGRIEVGASAEGGEAVLRVKDNGVGMSEELARTAFELFKQGEQAVGRPEGGLGVGLALVQRLVELHGGRVGATSGGRGRGSEFTVRLPLGRGEQAPLPPPEEEHERGSGRRVLVVDDNVDAANSLRYLLENEGHEVHVAHDGPEGIALARELKPEVLLLDIGLPHLSGLEIAEQVRADPALSHALLIAVTGYGQPQDRERSSQAGFDHHLTKPVDFQALQKLLRVTAD